MAILGFCDIEWGIIEYRRNTVRTLGTFLSILGDLQYYLAYVSNHEIVWGYVR